MEALERRGKVIALAVTMFIVFWSQCPGVEAAPRNTTKMSYVCPPKFIRLGYSCYYFSEDKRVWKSALFECKDIGANLTVPARWEDRNLRNYLVQAKLGNDSWWIGGMYDNSDHKWKWGGELRSMRYQSFSKMKKLSPEELEWKCIAMMPDLKYRWSAQNCFEPRQYICQTKLHKIPKWKLKSLRRRYQRMGNLNEISAPSLSKEVHDPKNDVINDITANPIHRQNPKSFDLRPSPLRENPRHKLRNTTAYMVRQRKHRPSPRRKLTRAFPGFQWNRRDPEGSYRYNRQLLLSGKLKLSQQRINSYLAWLQHMKDKQLARHKRLRDNDWLENDTRQALAHTHAKTYTIDNNISALHPKTIVEEFEMPAPSVIAPMVRANRAAG